MPTSQRSASVGQLSDFRIGRLEPLAKAQVDLGVIHQLKVVSGTYVVTVLGLEWDPSGASVSSCARGQDEDVAKQTPHGVVRAPGNRGEIGRAHV